MIDTYNYFPLTYYMRDGFASYQTLKNVVCLFKMTLAINVNND